jgi:hypothetical protein
MRVYGLDFTSSPGRRKPITCVAATLIEQALHVESLVVFECFDTFENFLGSPGPWIAAMDFPFGQPRKLRQNLGWPEDWVEIARLVGDMSPAEFERLLTEYREPRVPGDKHHRRDTDVLSGSQSPMTLYGVPVGKADDRRHQTPERADARRALLDVLKGPRLMVDFGLTLDLPDALTDEFAADATADRLDALLCAIQSAWSWTRRDQNFGVPHHADPVEGWVVDPGNLVDRGDKVVSL